MPHVHDMHNGSTLPNYLQRVVQYAHAQSHWVPLLQYMHSAHCTLSAISTQYYACTMHINKPYALYVKKRTHTFTITRTYKSGSLPAADFTRISFPAGCGPQSTRVAATRVVGGWRWLVAGGGGGGWGVSVHWCWHRIGSPASTISCCFSAPGVGMRMQLLNTAGTATHILLSFLLN